MRAACSVFGKADPSAGIGRVGRIRRSEFVRQNDFQPAANFPAVIGPDPRAPVTEITALRAKEMKQRITIALLVGRNSRFEHFLVEMRTGLLHWTQKFFVA